MKKLCFAIGVFVVLAWPHAAPMAARSVDRDQQRPQFKASSDLVEVYATAMSRSGAGVHDLRGDEFELFEDGKKRDITVFSAIVQPLSVAIVLDHSGSTNAEFSQVLQAAGSFIGRLFKEDRARIDTLGWDCAPFTSDRTTLIGALQKPLPRDPGSPVWSATDRAMSALVPESGRRVILLLSDGADNQSQIVTQPVPTGRASTGSPPSARPGRSADAVPHGCVRADISKPQLLKDVMERAEHDAVMIYAVAVPETDASGGVAFGGGSSMGGGGGAYGPPGAQATLLEHNGRTDLAKLTKRSGGSVQQLTNYSQLEAAFKIIADELHLQYLLGFVPSKFDGKRHDITVRVKRPGVSIRARETYIAERR